MRTFLFLQGPSSPVFARTADRLNEYGHTCLRINLCVGDWLFWRRKGAVNFRGGIGDWPDFIAAFIERNDVTDLVLLGEERPHHKIAATAAKAAGAQVFAIDMGYFRPDWVTVEHGGGGCNSHFPDDPRHILAAGSQLPEPDFDRLYPHSFFWEAVCDLLYNLSNVFFAFVFPKYRRHGLFHPLAEYAGWLRRLAGRRRRTRKAEAAIDAIMTGSTSYFVYPLQLETDYQIRAHSPFSSQRDVLGLVIESFARAAPPGSTLVFKLHPLDNGLIDWEGLIRRHAERHGIARRVHFIDGGNLDRLLAQAAGTVTINSTVGLQSIRLGTPTKVLGVAVYDVEGLCHRGTIDDFWRRNHRPDAALASALVRLIAVALNVRGNFYSSSGIEAAASAIAKQLNENKVNEPNAFVAVPPRPRPTKMAQDPAA